MSFKPRQNQRYYMIPKHIDIDKDGIMVLGVPAQKEGATIELRKFESGNQNQQFRFDPGMGGLIHWIKIHADNYLAIDNSSQDNGARLIEWKWEINKNNILFQHISAGNGFYRVMAVHSSKFFDVYDSKKAEGSGICQWEKAQGNNQLFKMVPVPNQPLDGSPVSFVETNEMFRTAMLSAIGFIPEAGTGLKFVIGFFWKEENKLTAFWNQMKSYVDERIKALIMEEKLKNLTDRLMGYLNLLGQIVESPGLKGEEIKVSVINQIVIEEPGFFKKSVEILPYIVAFGTLMISLRRAMLTDFVVLYGRQPTIAEVANNKKLLKAAIAKYTKEVADCVKDAVDWRKKLIPDAHTITETRKWRGDKWHYHTSTARDNFDGWSKEWKYTTGSDTKGVADHRQRAEYAVTERRKQVDVQFETDIKEFVRPSLTWKYFDPDEPAYVAATIKKSVGIYGGKNAYNRFASHDNRKITAILFHWWNNGNLCGIEIFQGPTGNGIQGCRGNREHKMTLDTDEYINNIYGFESDIINGLWFTTHKGRIGGGGSTTGVYFSADLADSFNAKLIKISGYNDTGAVEQLTFEWEYTE